MQQICIFDKFGLAGKQIKELSVWDKMNSFNLVETVVSNKEELLKTLNEKKADILIMVSDKSEDTSFKAVWELTQKYIGINIIVVGSDDRYSLVREYFISGAYDYLLVPLDENKFEESLLNLCKVYGINYIVNNLTMKTDALIDNIFLGGGQEQYIIEKIIDQIYADYNNDAVNCQIVSDKAKERVYELLVERKPWLEKFLYKDDFTYHFGFNVKTRYELIDEWINCFKEASRMVRKYQMIDDKLVYRIGKYVVVHVDEKLSLDSVSNGVFLNSSYVSHIFKKVTGMSFVDYMTEVKIDRAKVLLRNPKVKIYDVANTVGYNNPEYFTKNFKKKTGCSPVEYQREIAEII